MSRMGWALALLRLHHRPTCQDPGGRKKDSHRKKGKRSRDSRETLSKFPRVLPPPLPFSSPRRQSPPLFSLSSPTTTTLSPPLHGLDNRCLARDWTFTAAPARPAACGSVLLRHRVVLSYPRISVRATIVSGWRRVLGCVWNVLRPPFSCSEPPTASSRHPHPKQGLSFLSILFGSGVYWKKNKMKFYKRSGPNLDIL